MQNATEHKFAEKIRVPIFLEYRTSAGCDIPAAEKVHRAVVGIKTLWTMDVGSGEEKKRLKIGPKVLRKDTCCWRHSLTST